jgi:multiple sugar transport system permease protein
VLEAIGFEGQPWLVQRWSAFGIILLTDIWLWTPWFTLLLLAGLQSLAKEPFEAAAIDGTSTWRVFRYLTLPMLRPTLFTVMTLGLIGCWQVFDQIYTGTQGGPAKTTLTPAYLSFTTAFTNQQWGQGAAISFILFGIIVVLTLLQRWALGGAPDAPDRRSRRRRRATAVAVHQETSS